MSITTNYDYPNRINWNARFTTLDPSWYQQQKIRNAISTTLMLLGSVTGTATVVTAFTFTATPVVVIGTISTLAFTTLSLLSAAAIFRFCGRSWEDPDYCRSVGKKALVDIIHNGMSYRAIRDKYGAEIDAHGILTKEDLKAAIQSDIASMSYEQFKLRHGTEALYLFKDDVEILKALKKKFLAYFLNDNWSYKSLNRTYKEESEFLGVGAEDLAPLLKDHIRSHSYEKFSERHGLSCIPLVIPNECPEFEMLREKLRSHLRTRDEGIKKLDDLFGAECQILDITPEQRAECILIQQVVNLQNGAISYQRFLTDNGNDALNLLPSDLKDAVRNKVLEEISNDFTSMSLPSWIEKHSTSVIDSGIIPLADILDKLQQDLCHYTAIDQLVKAYSETLIQQHHTYFSQTIKRSIIGTLQNKSILDYPWQGHADWEIVIRQGWVEQDISNVIEGAYKDLKSVNDEHQRNVKNIEDDFNSTLSIVDQQRKQSVLQAENELSYQMESLRLKVSSAQLNKNNLDNEIRCCERALQEAKQKENQASAEIRRLESVSSTFPGQISDIELKIESSKQTQERLEGEIRVLNEEIHRLESEPVTGLFNAIAARSESKRKLGEVQVKQKEIECLKQLPSEKSKLESTLANAESEKKSQQITKELFANEHGRLSLKLPGLKRTRDEFADTLKREEAALSRIESKLTKKQKDLQNEYNQAVRQAESVKVEKCRIEDTRWDQQKAAINQTFKNALDRNFT